MPGAAAGGHLPDPDAPPDPARSGAGAALPGTPATGAPFAMHLLNPRLAARVDSPGGLS